MKKLIFGLAMMIATLFFADHALAYTVEKGDTMTKIASDHGMTLEELAEMNPQIENLDLIYVGQYIKTDPDESPLELVGGADGYVMINEIEQETPSPEKAVAKKEESSQNHSIQTNAVASAVGKFSDYELDLLARIVRAEAQGEPLEGKVAVAAVVLNRLESPKFPNTIKGVIYQPGQFSPVSNGAINRPADQESIRAVQLALSDMRHIAKGALFFYNPVIATSRWLDTRPTAVAIGRHVFKY